MTAAITAVSLNNASSLTANSADGDTLRSSEPFYLDRRDVAGPFSLIDHRPLIVDAVPGFVVRVRVGSLAISQERNSVEYIVHAGRHFRSRGSEPIVIRAFSRVELSLEWPPETQERAFGRDSGISISA